MADLFLTLIETGANQAYIFGSNRLREVVGASELLHRIGAVWALEEAREAEVIVATSGKALILTRDRDSARKIVTEVTRRALAEAPGVSVLGAICELPSADAGGLQRAMNAVHERHAALRSRLPGPEIRFPRLPMLDECGSTGLPASGIDANAPDTAMRQVSDVTRAKRCLSEAGWERIKGKLGDVGRRLPKNFKAFDERELAWNGVVHADGNGIGDLFLHFQEALGLEDGDSIDAYIKAYQHFSDGLDDCTRRAVAASIAAVWPDSGERAEIVPLVLGGDDLTVVCDGARAVRFAAEYLRAFEAGTAALVGDFRGRFATSRLGAAAGVAVVKPHHPFHRSYDLCEELTRSAKTVKRVARDDGIRLPCSALDFHILFDSSGADLDRIRDRLVTASGDRLYSGPFVVTDPAEIGTASGKWRNWAEAHHWTALEGAIAALSAKDAEDRSLLPRTQQHALREATFLGATIANGRLGAIRQRYPAFGWEAIAPGGALFFHAGEPKRDAWEEVSRTRLIDAMALVDVGGGNALASPEPARAGEPA